MKFKIEVKRTCIIINDYNLGDCPNVEKFFRIFDMYSYIYMGMIYNSETLQLILPRGIDVPFLEEQFGCRAYYDNRMDNCIDIEPIRLKYPPRNEKQVEVVNFLTGNGKYYWNRDYSQYLLALDTGSGKTYLGIFYIAYLLKTTIIITASVEWLKQWRDRLLEHTDISHKKIFFIKGTPSIVNLLSKQNYYSVYLVTHSTILNYANNCGWDKVRYLFSHLGIGLKIFDEAHLNSENMYNIDLNTSTYKTLYLTATPARGDDNENNIFKRYFKNIPKISLFDPDKDPHTRYVAIKYNSGMSTLDIDSCMTMHGFNKMVYCDKVIDLDNFKKICYIIFDILSSIPGKKLVFLSTNDSILRFKSFIELNFPEYIGNIGVYTSINPNKFEALNNPIILTTSKSAGAAVDIAGLTCSVQLAEPIKSEPQNKQRFGRTRGYNTLYIDVIDSSLSILRKYYERNLPMFEKYATNVSEVNFTNVNRLNDTFNSIMIKRNGGINPFMKL